MTTITIDRAVVEQVLEALEYGQHSLKQISEYQWESRGQLAMDALKAALAKPTVKESLQVEPAIAETATTQQQVEQTPPSEYRRGYWAGFEIGKREGRIEAEDALAEPVQEPVAKCIDDICSEHLGQVEAFDHLPRGTPLYAAPPQRKPLSAVDLRALYDRHAAYQEEGPEASGWWDFARAVERAHGIE